MTILPYWEVVTANLGVVGGALLCFALAYTLAYVDFSTKAASDEFNNYRNPFFHFKSMIWFSIVGTVATVVFLVSLNNQHPFFETISAGFTQPVIRGFAIACSVTAILKATLTTYRDSQWGPEGIYAFIQGKFISACRNDSSLMCQKLLGEYKGKFGKDNDFPNFLDQIVTRELRAVPYSDARKRELRALYDNVRALLPDVPANDFALRAEIYASMIRAALEFCPMSHMRRSLKTRCQTIDPQPSKLMRIRNFLRIQ